MEAARGDTIALVCGLQGVVLGQRQAHVAGGLLEAIRQFKLPLRVPGEPRNGGRADQPTQHAPRVLLEALDLLLGLVEPSVELPRIDR